LADAFCMIREVEPKSSLAAQKLAIDAGMVAIVGAQNFIVAYAQRRLASVRAMRARISHVSHFPRARLIAVSTAGESADRANVNAHAAFFAGEFTRLVWENHGLHTARPDAQRLHVHAFIADAHAAEAEDAARRVVINERRPLLFRVMQLFFREAAVVKTIAEGHVLQLALAALVAHRAIERMIREQEFDHIL